MKHWTETEFLRWLYTGDGDAGHLDICPECHARAQAISQHRRATTEPAEISWEFLAAQRRSVYRRLGTAQEHWLPRRWAVAVASLVCVVGLSVAVTRNGSIHPWASDTAPLYNSSEAKLFSDLESLDRSEGPQAIQPIRNLFQDGQE